MRAGRNMAQQFIPQIADSSESAILLFGFKKTLL